MIRNLKVLMLAAMAVAAFGAFSASGAHATSFHCSIEPCTVTAKADGTGKTAHHVFIIKQGAITASITCNGITGEATSTFKTTEELTFTNISYGAEGTCNLAGSAASVKMNGCGYLFRSDGRVDLRCGEGKIIQLIAGSCVVTIGAQINLEKVTYTNINSKKEFTVSTAVGGVAATADAGCASLLGFTGAATGEYTTGNTIVSADGGASTWWE